VSLSKNLMEQTQGLAEKINELNDEIPNITGTIKKMKVLFNWHGSTLERRAEVIQLNSEEGI
jgi:hypothetical protein